MTATASCSAACSGLAVLVDHVGELTKVGVERREKALESAPADVSPAALDAGEVGRGEVCSGCQRIRVSRNHVLGQFDTPKSRRSARSVPLSSHLAHELRAWQDAASWRDPDALVFAEPASGDVLRRGALMRRYRRALKAAKIDPHRFHDLRHTFGTAMAAAGVPMRTLQEWMGHRDIATTQRYADYAPNEREVEMVDRAFRDQSRKASSQ